MKKLYFILVVLSITALIFNSCQKEENDLIKQNPVPQEVINKIANMGFNPEGIQVVENGYRIERDIIITHEMLEYTPSEHKVPFMEQYSTNNLVKTNGGRVISVYAPEEGNTTGGKGKKGGSNGFSPGMLAALDLAIERYNDENLEISFTRVSSARGADIVMTRLNAIDEQSGVLGSAGFPTRRGDPYGEIQMSGILESFYGLSTQGIATIIAHEMGHCIGFRHTDWFDRSISCGGNAINEGESNIGANHIPDTPTDATYREKSWMLSCTDGGDRPFNRDDQTALDYLY